MNQLENSAADNARNAGLWTPRASGAALIGPHKEDDAWLLPGTGMLDVKHWFGCRISPSLFDLIWMNKLEGLQFSMGTFVDEQQADYGFIVHQIESMQHRLLLPLYEARIRGYLDRLDGKSFGFIYMNDEDPGQVHAFRALCSGSAVQELLSRSMQLKSAELTAARARMRSTVQASLHPKAIPTLTEVKVEEVCASFATHALNRVSM